MRNDQEYLQLAKTIESSKESDDMLISLRTALGCCIDPDDEITQLIREAYYKRSVVITSEVLKRSNQEKS